MNACGANQARGICVSFSFILPFFQKWRLHFRFFFRTHWCCSVRDNFKPRQTKTAQAAGERWSEIWIEWRFKELALQTPIFKQFQCARHSCSLKNKVKFKSKVGKCREGDIIGFSSYPPKQRVKMLFTTQLINWKTDTRRAQERLRYRAGKHRELGFLYRFCHINLLCHFLCSNRRAGNETNCKQ